MNALIVFSAKFDLQFIGWEDNGNKCQLAEVFGTSREYSANHNVWVPKASDLSNCKLKAFGGAFQGLPQAREPLVHLQGLGHFLELLLTHSRAGQLTKIFLFVFHFHYPPQTTTSAPARHRSVLSALLSPVPEVTRQFRVSRAWNFYC